MAPGGRLGADHHRSLVFHRAGGADRVRQHAPHGQQIAQGHLAKPIISAAPGQTTRFSIARAGLSAQRKKAQVCARLQIWEG
jgi:hypothetical protein